MRILRIKQFCVMLLAGAFISCAGQQQYDVTFASLLDEMVDYDEVARYPSIIFKAMQESSYDRRSIHPDSAGWFANNDGFGFIRTDIMPDGRKENVLFEQDGPGVITRFWLTAMDKRGTMRFYFDHHSEPQLIIPAYDLMRSGLGLGKGLLQPHPNYRPDNGKGGNTLFLPIPYAAGCKITFELPDSVEPTPKYYGVNFRKYPARTRIETFSKDLVKENLVKLKQIDSQLLSPNNYMGGMTVSQKNLLLEDSTLVLSFPEGVRAIRLLQFNVQTDSVHYEQVMRDLVLYMDFDGTQTVAVPLSDFSGAGMGAKCTSSWFLDSDGKGKVTSRWVMPYRQKGNLQLANEGKFPCIVSVSAVTDMWEWDDRSLYFHVSWKQENSIHVESDYDNDDACVEWNFTTLKGRGVYRGDVLSLFNHTLAWYGEGDEKIWIDDDIFPSHFGTGTEDYYNSSWAPVIPFYTPFGGAPRADTETSTGYNTFFRTRNMDQIPFSSNLRFDIEVLGWISGEVDYAATVFWYGDIESEAVGYKKVPEMLCLLLPPPEDPTDFQISPYAIEFEESTAVYKSSELYLDVQNMLTFPNGKWSGGKQMLFTHGKIGDYVEFEFEVPEEHRREIAIYATKASDYGIVRFSLKGQEKTVVFDGYAPSEQGVLHVGPIDLGDCTPVNGKVCLRVELLGKNPDAIGSGGIFGLDCIIIE